MERNGVKREAVNNRQYILETMRWRNLNFNSIGDPLHCVNGGRGTIAPPWLRSQAQNLLLAPSALLLLRLLLLGSSGFFNPVTSCHPTQPNGGPRREVGRPSGQHRHHVGLVPTHLWPSAQILLLAPPRGGAPLLLLLSRLLLLLSSGLLPLLACPPSIEILVWQFINSHKRRLNTYQNEGGHRREEG